MQKVVQLLSELEGKIVKEGEAAQKTFKEFGEWCEERNANLGFEIKTGTAKVASLKAAIEKASSEMSALSTSIDETAAAVAHNEADLKAATSIRKQEVVDFEAEEKELAEIVDLLTRAIGILEREARKGSASMLQFPKAEGVVEALRAMVTASMFASQDADRLTALLQDQTAQDQDDASDDFGAPDPSAYENHSGSIISTLQGLLDKAEEQLEGARKKEVAAKHNFQMLKQSLEDDLKAGTEDMSEAKQRLASEQTNKAGAEGDLEATSKGLAVDQDTQGTLKQDCMAKSQDFESEMKSRAEELKALAQAKSALEAATAGADSLAYTAPASFLQLDDRQQAGLRTSVDLANFEAVRVIRNLAQHLHSEALTQLANRMVSVMHLGASSGNDPFGKVKTLIENMIAKLERDSQSDASHKAYCDKEMSETVQKKTEKGAELDKLSTQIDSMTARSVQLKEEIAATQAALSELVKAQAQATTIRREEKTEFERNKPEMEEGIRGVQMALKILREYYAQSGKSHAAAEGSASSIVGFLEVVQADFARLLAEMKAAEASSQSEYDTDSRAFDIERAAKESSVSHMTKQSNQLAKTVAEYSSDREGVGTELSAILEYKTKLDEMCIAKPETFSERKGRREAEIAGLREALAILNGEAVLLQRRRPPGHQLRGRQGSWLSPGA